MTLSVGALGVLLAFGAGTLLLLGFAALTTAIYEREPQRVREMRVLQMLERGPRSGTDLTTELGGIQFYPLIRGMEADGLLASGLAGPRIPQRGNRQRRYYTLTPFGRSLLGVSV